jgi:von Willebrand factor A domain-containing protein 5
LKAIFDMALAEKEMKRQIYLLTDGAVHNT